MKTFEARVVNGRLIVQEPTDLPEGTVLRLAVADEADDLDEEERDALHAALDASWKSACAGKTRPVEEILEETKPRS